MITIDGKQYRNLEEQVLQNQKDIQYILNEAGVLNEFGIKVVGHADTFEEIPNPWNGEYGDAFAVGADRPYTFYIWTRAFSGTIRDFWFNIGQFPLPSTIPGPVGPTGPVGEKGERGTHWWVYSNETGTIGPDPSKVLVGDLIYNIPQNALEKVIEIKEQESGGLTIVSQSLQSLRGPVGPRGPKGEKGDPSTVPGPVGPIGPQGPQGKFLYIAGKLDNVGQLPTPSESIREQAYLIGEELYAIVGTTSLLWEPIGSFTGSANIIIDGEKVDEVDLSNFSVNGVDADVTAIEYSDTTGIQMAGSISGTNAKGNAFTIPDGFQATVPIIAGEGVKLEPSQGQLILGVNTKNFVRKVSDANIVYGNNKGNPYAYKVAGYAPTETVIPLVTNGRLNVSNPVATTEAVNLGYLKNVYTPTLQPTDSDTIITSGSVTTGDLSLNLNNELVNKINNSMQLPAAAPTVPKIVGINTSGAQELINYSDIGGYRQICFEVRYYYDTSLIGAGTASCYMKQRDIDTLKQAYYTLNSNTFYAEFKRLFKSRYIMSMTGLMNMTVPSTGYSIGIPTSMYAISSTPNSRRAVIELTQTIIGDSNIQSGLTNVNITVLESDLTSYEYDILFKTVIYE